MSRIAIDLFSGCGGLSLGLKQAGFDHLFAIEAHPDAFSTYYNNLIKRSSYQERWPSWLPMQSNDIEAVISKYLPELKALRGSVDLLAGGPPCQGFSMNGRRDPADPRSRMIKRYFEFVAAVQPRVVLLENVRGFVSMPHENGGCYPDFAKAKLDELGYEAHDVVLSASDWGVPQRRPRYILIAFKKGSLPGVDPIARLKVKRRNFLEGLGLWPGPTSVKDALFDLETNGKELRLDPEWGHAGFEALKYRAPKDKSAYLRLMRDGWSGHPGDMRLARHSAKVSERMRTILASCDRGQAVSIEDRKRLGIKKRSTTPLDPGAPSPTITTLPDDLIHYSEPRTMTVREHARIQSFPDWFKFSGRYTTGGDRRKKDCPRFTQVGNAVPPLLARAIGETILSLLDDQKSMNLPDRPQVAEEAGSMGREVSNGHKHLPIFV